MRRGSIIYFNADLDTNRSFVEVSHHKKSKLEQNWHAKEQYGMEQRERDRQREEMILTHGDILYYIE